MATSSTYLIDIEKFGEKILLYLVNIYFEMVQSGSMVPNKKGLVPTVIQEFIFGFRLDQYNMYTLTIVEHNLHKEYICRHHISTKSFKRIIQMNHTCTIGEKSRKPISCQVVLYWLSLTYAFTNA